MRHRENNIPGICETWNNIALVARDELSLVVINGELIKYRRNLDSLKKKKKGDAVTGY